MDVLISTLSELPPATVYVLLGLGAAIENVFPPLPADTFVVLGGFLTANGFLRARTVFLVTWACNVSMAMVVYRMGYVYGRPFFEVGAGRFVLNDHQLDRLAGFYERWGAPSIFVARFLPGLRAVVPVFAGVTHQPARAVWVPVVFASAIWYGVLVWLGGLAGANVDVILGVLADTNRALAIIATAVALLIAAAWWRTRHPRVQGADAERPDSGLPGKDA